MLLNSIVLLSITTLALANNYSQYVESNCKECVSLNFVFYKSVYSIAPIDYLCKEPNENLPIGFIVADIVHLPEDCVGVHNRSIQSKHKQYLNNWISYYYNNFKQSLEAKPENSTIFTCITFSVAVISYFICLFLREIVSRVKTKVIDLYPTYF